MTFVLISTGGMRLLLLAGGAVGFGVGAGSALFCSAFWLLPVLFSPGAGVAQALIFSFPVVVAGIPPPAPAAPGIKGAPGSGARFVSASPVGGVMACTGWLLGSVVSGAPSGVEERPR